MITKELINPFEGAGKTWEGEYSFAANFSFDGFPAGVLELNLQESQHSGIKTALTIEDYDPRSVLLISDKDHPKFIVILGEQVSTKTPFLHIVRADMEMNKGMVLVKNDGLIQSFNDEDGIGFDATNLLPQPPKPCGTLRLSKDVVGRFIMKPSLATE